MCIIVINIYLQIGKFLPPWLRDVYTVQHARKLETIFSHVNGFRHRSQNTSLEIYIYVEMKSTDITSFFAFFLHKLYNVKLAQNIPQVWMKPHTYSLPVQIHCNIVGKLTAHTQDYAIRIFHTVNVHHSLKIWNIVCVCMFYLVKWQVLYILIYKSKINITIRNQAN